MPSWSAAVRADHVDDVIAAQMKERGIPGVALAVVESSTIVGQQAYGWSDKDWQIPNKTASGLTPECCFFNIGAWHGRSA